MSSISASVELLPSKEIELFLPVLREIELGDQFLLSMLHWCGIGQRSTPLAYWQVYLIKHSLEIIGVTGLYQRPETDQYICWLGWFGIRPQWRRHGLGTATVGQVMALAKNRGGQKLWVYTGAKDAPAAQFYQSLGFELLGTAAQWAPSQTADDSDMIFQRRL